MTTLTAPIGCPINVVNDLFDTTGNGKKMPLNKSQGFTTIEPTIYGWIQYDGLLRATQVIVCCGGVAYLLEISNRTKKVIGKPDRQAHFTANGWSVIRDGETPIYFTKESFDNFLKSWRR